MRKAILIGAVTFFGVVLGSVVAVQPMDLDGDGLSTLEESEAGTKASQADTDVDGIEDGWEVERGLNPTAPDSDGDGPSDRHEVDWGSNPQDRDTDGDGLSDTIEAPDRLEDADCNDDGISSIRATDDDADGRPDADEGATETCDPDIDSDQVLDGDERNPACIHRADCDQDGVADAEERAVRYDPLNPDTFDVHLPDSISLAFARRGQPAGNDTDRDGIPDPWEGPDGLIQWGSFAPKPGQRDVLVEFVRVLGPDSGRHADLPVGNAYPRLRDAFAAAGFVMQYVETRVTLSVEPVPSLLPTRTATFYREILDRAQYSANPYVLTVVLNPQLDQSEVGHSGIAPIRGMLAAVDVGQYVNFTFTGDGWTVWGLSSYDESLIRAGKLSSGGVLADGRYWVGLSGGSRFEWRPSWFVPGTATLRFANGTTVAMTISSRVLYDDRLASTILHEMGHTLGLCHTHLEDCRALLPLSEQLRQAESTMSYDSAPATLSFLPGEWDRVRTYLSCPPPGPIQRIANNQSRDAVLDAKYAYSLDNLSAIETRKCEDFERLPWTLLRNDNATAYVTPAAFAPPPVAKNDATATQVYGWGAFFLAAALGARPIMKARRRT